MNEKPVPGEKKIRRRSFLTGMAAFALGGWREETVGGSADHPTGDTQTPGDDTPEDKKKELLEDLTNKYDDPYRVFVDEHAHEYMADPEQNQSGGVDLRGTYVSVEDISENPMTLYFAIYRNPNYLANRPVEEIFRFEIVIDAEEDKKLTYEEQFNKRLKEILESFRPETRT